MSFVIVIQTDFFSDKWKPKDVLEAKLIAD